MEAFIYIWRDNLTQKRYIGSHKGQPDDGYICSSETMMEQYNSHPDFFVRKILKFGSFEEMRELEAKLCEKVDAARSDKFYNRHNGSAKFFCDKLAARKISKTKKGRESTFKNRKHSAISIEKNRQAHIGKIPWNKGKKGLQIAWNKGLDRTDPRVAKYADKSENKKGIFPWNKGLTKDNPIVGNRYKNYGRKKGCTPWNKGLSR